MPKMRSKLLRQLLRNEKYKRGLRLSVKHKSDITPVKAPATRKGQAEGEPGMSSSKTSSSKKQVMDKPEEHVTTPTNKEERKRQSDEQVMKAAAEKKAVTEEEEDQPAAVLPPRRKMLARRTKPKERPTKTKFYPFITTEEKALIGDWASKKQVIR